MRQRGRQSAAAREIAPAGAVALIRRPDAPLELTPEQQVEWLKVTEALPADWFTPENFPLLTQYVRHTVEARRIAQLIDVICAAEDLDVRGYTALLKAQRQESAALKTLAASMRLAQQARYQARGAENAKARAPQMVKRPWESD